MTADLVHALAAGDGGATILAAKIVSVESNGTATIDFGGSRFVPGCRVLASYTPAPGDTVEVVRRDASSFLVIGAVRDTAPASVTLASSIGLAWNLTEDGGATGATGTLNVGTTMTYSYRSTGGWKYPAVYQGAYSGQTQWGYWRGCYFYGNAFGSLKGRTATRLRITITRGTSGGIAGEEDVWIAPHVHATRPSGSPIFKAAAVKVGTLSWGEQGTFDLPVSWGQGLINGTLKGFGHIKDSTSVYSIFRSLADDPDSGDLILDWKE